MIDEKFETALNNMYDFLKKGEETDALDSTYPYLPKSTSASFHYALYKFEKAVLFSDEFLDERLYLEGQSPNKLIDELVDNAYLANPEETMKALRWFKDSDLGIHEKMIVSDSGVRLLDKGKPLSVDTEILSVYKQHLDAYKDKFEIKGFMILIANLILIPQGKTFSKKPFLDNKIRFGNTEVDNGTYIKTGLAIKWICNNLSDKNRLIITNAYNAKIRNISGHNDYILDTEKNIVTEDNSTVLGMHELEATLRSLYNLQVSIKTNVSIKLFDYDEILGEEWTSLGLIAWRFDMNEDKLYIFQSFAMFDPDQQYKSINFIGNKIPGGKIVSITFDRGLIVPYDMSVLITPEVEEWFETILKKDSIKIIWYGVAPKYPPFSEISDNETVLIDNDLVILGTKEMVVPVPKDSLNKLLDD